MNIYLKREYSKSKCDCGAPLPPPPVAIYEGIGKIGKIEVESTWTWKCSICGEVNTYTAYPQYKKLSMFDKTNLWLYKKFN
jgi:hypothetical protein